MTTRPPARDWGTHYGGWALVTGASAGLGAELARSLAARGMSVALVARRADRLDALAAELRSAHGVEALPIPLDLAAPDVLDPLRAALGDRPVGLLANNAGFGLARAFHQQPLDRVAAMVDLNCRAVAILARAFVEPMIARRRGAILTVSSVVAFETVPWFSLYAATKAFDLMLGEGMAVELEPYGIDCLTICPGVTATEFADVAGTRNLTRAVTPRDVVEAALARLGRRRTYVHGFSNRLAIALLRRLVPRRAAPALVGRVTRRMITPEAEEDLQRTARREQE